ncbi:MAG: hypothetical protein ACYC9Y_03425 [Candidatus Methylomirabilia bacterium]
MRRATIAGCSSCGKSVPSSRTTRHRGSNAVHCCIWASVIPRILWAAGLAAVTAPSGV